MTKPGNTTSRPLRRSILAFATTFVVAVAWASAASAGPASTRLIYAPGEIVPIPAAIPHEEGDMVDSRIVPDLRWIARHYPIYVTDGYSGPLPNGEHVGCNMCHVEGSDHYNGLAVDLVPLNGTNGKCNATWAPITRLALWAEPTQNHPVPPFRWVGYDGDAGHGCGNHLHLSWQHAAVAQFQLAEWVEVFPVGNQPAGQPRTPRPKAPKAPPPGPSGGFSTIHSGGLSQRSFSASHSGGLPSHGD
jgi:hypothetical protein